MTQTLSFDVLIIGSGAGGGTVAERLSKHCKDGLRLGIVEAGPHFVKEDFNMKELDMLKLFQQRGGVATPNFELTIAAGECVGGSTTMYTGVTFRTPKGLVQQWSDDFGLPELREDDIQGRFDGLEQSVNAHIPDPKTMENPNNRLFREGCEKLGWPVKQFKINIKDCVGCGFCNLGCPFGAKRGTLEVQLPKAIVNGAQLIANCRIHSLQEGRAYGSIQRPPEGALPNTVAEGDVVIEAKTIILAAGTMGTPALLMRSRDKLPDVSPAVGKYVTLHPALMSFARFADEVRGFEGFPKLYFTDQFSKEHHYYLETAFYFPFVTAKSLPDFGPEHRAFMKNYKSLTCALTLVHDEAERHNGFELQGDTAVLNYRLSEQSKDAIVHAQRSAGEIFFAAGAQEYVSPVSRTFRSVNSAELSQNIDRRAFINGRVVVSSAHPMGGARMGSDVQESVTDAWGKVHGYDNIYVADGSLFPTSSKVNPYLSIMAFADRIGEHIESRLT